MTILSTTELIMEQLSKEDLVIAARQRTNHCQHPISVRLTELSLVSKDHLGRLAILNGSLSIQGIQKLLDDSSSNCSMDEVKTWVL